MKEQISFYLAFYAVIFATVFGMVFATYKPLWPSSTYQNGVLEGRCLERGGTMHNVDGELLCLYNLK